MKCCGQECVTPFCPMCGKTVETDHIIALRKMLKFREMICRRAERRIEDEDVHPGSRERAEHRIETQRPFIAALTAAIAAIKEMEENK